MTSPAPTDKTPVAPKAPDVPTQVFEEFFQALATAATSKDAIDRLRKTLLADKTFSERALKDAVFGEESRP